MRYFDPFFIFIQTAQRRALPDEVDERGAEKATALFPASFSYLRICLFFYRSVHNAEAIFRPELSPALELSLYSGLYSLTQAQKRSNLFGTTLGGITTPPAL